MHWDDIQAFIAIAQNGSFSSAAVKLDLSVATLGRKLDRLESDIGLTLAYRSPKGLQLTEAGEKILAIAIAGGEELDQIARVAVSLKADSLREPVRVSSTEPIISHILAPSLSAFLREHASIQLDLSVSTAIDNLNKREADLAIRLAKPHEPTLMCRKLGEIKYGLFVNSSLLEGMQPGLDAIERLPLLGFNDDFGPIPEREWIAQQGLDAAVRVKSSSLRALYNASCAGAGAALLPTFIARHASELVLLTNVDALLREVWLVFHRDLKDIPSVVATRAWIYECVSEALK